MDEEKPHHQLEDARLSDRVTSQASHHITVTRQIRFSEQRFVEAYLLALDYEKEGLLVISKVWRAEYHRWPKQLHVRNAFVAAIEGEVNIEVLLKSMQCPFEFHEKSMRGPFFFDVFLSLNLRLLSNSLDSTILSLFFFT